MYLCYDVDGMLLGFEEGKDEPDGFKVGGKLGTELGIDDPDGEKVLCSCRNPLGFLSFLPVELLSVVLILTSSGPELPFIGFSMEIFSLPSVVFFQ
mmetsp:Transcript_13319/g.19588  ORF Transcript_13319/g.19588 Transcript_13319/m.19588 type:complete len:96 (+) Transcript_13319:57-344(+)